MLAKEIIHAHRTVGNIELSVSSSINMLGNGWWGQDLKVDVGIN